MQLGNLYCLQQALTKASDKVAYVSKNFHQETKYWQHLVNKKESCPTYLAEIIQRLPTTFGLTGASGMRAGGVWTHPNKDNQNFVWRVQWSVDIQKYLVRWYNSNGQITRSDLDLAVLVLQESFFPLVFHDTAWHAPIIRSDNTPTVSWSFKEASTINLLFRIFFAFD